MKRILFCIVLCAIGCTVKSPESGPPKLYKLTWRTVQDEGEIIVTHDTDYSSAPYIKNGGTFYIVSCIKEDVRIPSYAVVVLRPYEKAEASE